MFGPESLLPPLIAIAAAILSRRVLMPLALGLLVGSLLLASRSEVFSIWLAIRLFIDSLWSSLKDNSHLQVFAFTLLLGAMVGVMESGGGMRSLVRSLSKKIRDRRGAQTMISLGGLAIFFDDYANTVLLGSTMRSTADQYGISRAKLAYLVDSTSAPIAGLSLVSTWTAIEISYLSEGLVAAGIDDPSAAFSLFLASIPYRFYPLLAIVMVFFISLTGRDYGAMRVAELEMVDSQKSEKTLDRKPSDDDSPWFSAVLPIAACLLVVIGTLVVTGSEHRGNHADESVLRIIINVLGNGDAFLALVLGGIVGLIVALLAHGLMTHRGPQAARSKTLIKGAFSGAKQMVPALAILWLAWALSAMTEPDALGTGKYLTTLLSHNLAPESLPTVVFLVSGFVAFATGTSWGTMGILTPIAVTLSVGIDSANDPYSTICLSTSGAVLAGAILGDHCSPISDTTVLSSRACGCNHIKHVRTQMPYAITVASICVLVGYIPSVLGLSPWISLLTGTLMIAATVRFLGTRPVVEELGS